MKGTLPLDFEPVCIYGRLRCSCNRDLKLKNSVKMTFMTVDAQEMEIRGVWANFFKGGTLDCQKINVVPYFRGLLHFYD